MGDATGIEWTDATWNPIRGCSRVSEGCRHCYAERVAWRFGGPGQPYEGLTRNGRWTGEVRVVESAMDQPLRWQRPRRIFVNSMSDLFHPALGLDVIDRVFAVMRAAPRHTFQVLTKRPAVMAMYTTSMGLALPNVWLGTSVEDQRAADDRVPWLMRTQAAVRFLSIEPLLGPVDLSGWERSPGAVRGIDWVIVGGESGPGSRPMDPAWARGVRDWCVAHGVPFLFKQWGETGETGRRVGKLAAGRVLDGRTWDQYPFVATQRDG